MLYARVMPMYGASVDRRTPTYKSERTLLQGIRREVKRLRQPGPYLVMKYEGGRCIGTSQEG